MVSEDYMLKCIELIEHIKYLEKSIILFFILGLGIGVILAILFRMLENSSFINKKELEK